MQLAGEATDLDLACQCCGLKIEPLEMMAFISGAIRTGDDDVVFEMIKFGQSHSEHRSKSAHPDRGVLGGLSPDFQFNHVGLRPPQLDPDRALIGFNGQPRQAPLLPPRTQLAVAHQIDHDGRDDGHRHGGGEMETTMELNGTLRQNLGWEEESNVRGFFTQHARNEIQHKFSWDGGGS